MITGSVSMANCMEQSKQIQSSFNGFEKTIMDFCYKQDKRAEDNHRMFVMQTGLYGAILFDLMMIGIEDTHLLPFHHYHIGKRVKDLFISLFNKHGRWKVIVRRKQDLKLELRCGTEIIGSYKGFKEVMNKINEYDLHSRR